MTEAYVYPAEARYRLGSLLVATSNLRACIARRKWHAAYAFADQMDVLLNDPHLTAIRRPDDITGKA